MESNNKKYPSTKEKNNHAFNSNLHKNKIKHKKYKKKKK